ncbi:MAG: hypothetical protein K9K64_01885 [Desulfohalobiaceae bacterium]|nr:hypothetical protein [Desulfohalobiaceae bacterium]
MNSMEKHIPDTEEYLTEDAKIEALAWRIYDIIFNYNRTQQRTKYKKYHSHREYDYSGSQVEDLFDMLHIDA